MMPDSHPLSLLAERWLLSDSRPRPAKAAMYAMHKLVVDSSQDKGLPLIVRRMDGRRGQELEHHTGRKLVLADNSPANWSYACALQGLTPDLGTALQDGTLPLAFFLPKAERAAAKYPNPLNRAHPKSLNPEWEVCHLDDVRGRAFRGDICKAPIEMLEERMVLLMSPTNIFLVHGKVGRGNPLGETTGCGDQSHFVAEFKNARAQKLYDWS
jgi:hypothetical protein